MAASIVDLPIDRCPVNVRIRRGGVIVGEPYECRLSGRRRPFRSAP